MGRFSVQECGLLLLFSLGVIVFVHEVLKFPTIRRVAENPNRPAEEGMKQTHPALITHIRRRLVPPSHLPYKLANPKKEHFSQFGETAYMMKNFLNDMRDGFFVEVGAVDGEVFSNSLFLERRMGWKGLLIEANPTTYQQLLGKHRKSHHLHAALSFTDEFSFVSFEARGHHGVVGHVREDGASNKTVEVEAYPLYSILLAMNRTEFDFLSLDIEGGEMKVLKTVPWDKVKIRILCVEKVLTPEGEPAIINFLVGKGYRYLATQHFNVWFGYPGLIEKTMKKP